MLTRNRPARIRPDGEHGDDRRTPQLSFQRKEIDAVPLEHAEGIQSGVPEQT
jgi:hypothetical protein